MRQNAQLTLLATAAMLFVGGCASVPPPHDPAHPAVMLVDSLYFTNAMDGKPDVQRTVRALAPAAVDVAFFPLAQVKQCDKEGAPCSWGVLNAKRSVEAPHYLPNGISLKVDVLVDIDRRQSVNRPDYAMSMAIPSDIPALTSKQTIKQDMVVEYGKPTRVELKHGIVYQLCAMRLDAARQPIDQCNITDY